MEFLVQGNLPLVRGSLVRIEDGREMLVYVWSGSIWVTQEGDGRDRHVRAGGWVRINAAGLTLISALERCAIALTSPYEEGFAERVELVRPGTGQVVPIFVMPGKLEALRARVAKTWSGWFAPLARPTTAAL
jgi:Protein of unknown function (DUF2917)